MAPTVIESAVTEDFNLSEENTCLFISAMVSYARRFHDLQNPPELNFRISLFTSNLGNAIVRLMKCLINPSLDGKIQYVVITCLSIPEAEYSKIMDAIGPFLDIYKILLESPSPYAHIRYFSILCRLCVKFYEAERPDLVGWAKAYTVFVLRDHSNCLQAINVLDMHAVRILRALGFTLLPL